MLAYMSLTLTCMSASLCAGHLKLAVQVVKGTQTGSCSISLMGVADGMLDLQVPGLRQKTLITLAIHADFVSCLWASFLKVTPPPSHVPFQLLACLQT